MKKLLLLSLLVCTSFVVFAQKEKTQLRHVVLFTFKATSSKEDVAKLNCDEVFNFVPYLWTKEGKDIEKSSKKDIEIERTRPNGR